MRPRHVLIIAAALAGAPALAQAAPLELPPQEFTFETLGTSVTFPVTADLNAVAEGEERVVTGTVSGSLGDLQAKALQIAQAMPLPANPCANENGLNVVVDGIQGASIEPAGNTARLAATGTVTAYGCLLGVGAAVATTQLAIAVPLVIEVTSPTEVGLALAGPVDVAAAGLPAEVFAPLTDQITSAVTAALAEARTEVPLVIEGLPDLGMEISDAEFFAEGETLMVRMSGTARMSADTFAGLLAELGATAPAGL